MRYPHTHWRAYHGSVSRFTRQGVEKTIWKKGQRLSEEDVAKALTDAYNKGRKDMLDDVRNALGPLK